jgi:hypothetical protein
MTTERQHALYAAVRCRRYDQPVEAFVPATLR